MKKIILVVVVIVAIITVLIMISKTDTSSSTQSFASQKLQTTTEAQDDKVILNKVSVDLKQTSDTMLNDFNASLKNAPQDIEGRKKMTETHVQKLQDMAKNGLSQLDKVRSEKGKNNQNYNDYATQIKNLYSEKSKTLIDAYNNSIKTQ